MVGGQAALILVRRSKCSSSAPALPYSRRPLADPSAPQLPVEDHQVILWNGLVLKSGERQFTEFDWERNMKDAKETTAAVTAIEARAIAKEAYIYGFPMVDNYRIQYGYFVDCEDPEYKAPWNHLKNISRVFTPADKTVQTPNSDTPYSWAGFDLRTEPIVITVPPVENGRYFSVQLIDLYTHNFDYLGSRTTGNDGGSFMIAGPDWQGEAPAEITKVIRCETQLALALFRIQLFDPGDLDNVKTIQSRCNVQPLSTFLGKPATRAASSIDFIKSLTPDQQRTSLEFFNVLNFTLQFCRTDRSEKDLRVRLAKLGIDVGKTFDASELTPEIRQAVTDGMADAWEDFHGTVQYINAGELTSGDLFGTREFMKNNYLYRMTGAALGIYGNSKQEAMYPPYFVDGAGQKLDGSKNRYALRFTPGQLPPVNSFWSLTLYEQPASLLSANSLDRYLINSPMLPDLKRDVDGGLTLYIQHASPGKDEESNWLPAPNGPFSLIMRLYWPKPEALDGTWKQPMLQAADMQAQSLGRMA